MKRFLGLLTLGFLLFMALAIADEWSFFSSAWFGGGTPEPGQQPAGEAELAAFLTDFSLRVGQRYSAPFPGALQDTPGAGPETAGELRADLMYLKHRGWTQAPSLRRLEVDAVTAVSPERLEVRTREWWSHTLVKGGAEERRESEVRCLYRLRRAGETWEIVGWDAMPPGDFGQASDGTGGPS